jgi:hypothetical protein
VTVAVAFVVFIAIVAPGDRQTHTWFAETETACEAHAAAFLKRHTHFGLKDRPGVRYASCKRLSLRADGI